MDAACYSKSYCPRIPENLYGLLGDGEYLTFLICSVPENIENASVNLKSPIFINWDTKKGAQAILGEAYPVRYYFLKKEARPNAHALEKKDESFVIDLGDEVIRVMITRIGVGASSGKKEVQVGIDAPKQYKVWRTEIYDTIEENKKAVAHAQENRPERLRGLFARK